MPGLAHLMVYSMVFDFYGQEEAKRKMSRYYGFAEASAGSPSPEREGRIIALCRRVSTMFAATAAAVQRL
ncbi:MAG: hypothetical protein ACJ789_02305 [Thermomicrobiales bacterium]